jgi:hypothetical protein
MSCALLAGCLSQSAASRLNAVIDNGMSQRELATARTSTLRVVRSEHATHVTAQVSLSGSDPSATSAGDAHPCSGRLLMVSMTGVFPQSPHSSGGMSGQTLTLDARTGKVCAKKYGAPQAPQVDSVQLFSL